MIELASHQEKMRTEVLEQLFVEHKEALCTYIRRRARYIEEPDDIAQEVFLRIANSPDLVDRIRAGMVHDINTVYDLVSPSLKLKLLGLRFFSYPKNR